MESVDSSINESKCMVSFDRSAGELQGLKSDSFNFRIEPAYGGKETAILEIKKDGTVLRRNDSEPFPAGTFQKKSVDLNRVNYNVTLKKSDKSAKLGDYFV